MSITQKIKYSETVIIKRDQIHFAAYNPRKKDARVVEQLKRNFKRVGFLGGIQWNPLSGNLIGGHKRLEALDLIHNYDGTSDKNYDVKVESIELDEKTEKEQNIFLNNRKAQGEMDYELLADIINDIDIENAMLDDYDIEIMNSIIPDFNFGGNEEIKTDINVLRGDDERKKENVKNIKNKMKNIVVNSQQESYFVVTFGDPLEKSEFLEGIGINGDTIFIKNEDFMKRLNG